jgi:hypothetical protein
MSQNLFGKKLTCPNKSEIVASTIKFIEFLKPTLSVSSYLRYDEIAQ